MIKTYESERLQIKPLSQEGAPQVLAFYEDNRMSFEPWEPLRAHNFYTLSYQKASLSAEYNQMTEGKLIRYWAFLKDNPDEIIGSICFQNLLREPFLSCCLGYKISHSYQHQGYATELIQKGIEIVFQEYHMHRIDAYIMPNNEPSIHLIKKLSFEYEGICHSFAKVNGIWSDHLRFALVNPS